jgi:methylmalonyl-CoA mutase N-terminal domain/subunit
VIAYESGIADTVDAFAGSYYIEYLTDEIEKGVWKYLEKIDSMGGAVKCIEVNYQQDEIASNAYEFEKEIESGQRIIVGVNKFIDEETTESPELLKIDESIQKKQIDSLKKVKENRNNDEVKANLEALKQAAGTNENIIPHILKCVESYSSIGEISNTLRSVWGEY